MLLTIADTSALDCIMKMLCHLNKHSNYVVFIFNVIMLVLCHALSTHYKDTMESPHSNKVISKLTSSSRVTSFCM